MPFARISPRPLMATEALQRIVAPACTLAGSERVAPPDHTPAPGAAASTSPRSLTSTATKGCSSEPGITVSASPARQIAERVRPSSAASGPTTTPASFSATGLKPDGSACTAPSRIHRKPRASVPSPIVPARLPERLMATT